MCLCLFVRFGVWLTALQAHQAAILPERLQALGQEHIIVAQEQALSDQVYSILDIPLAEHNSLLWSSLQTLDCIATHFMHQCVH